MGFRSISRSQVPGFNLPKQDNPPAVARATARRKGRGKANDKTGYPGKVSIKRAGEAARALGIDIAGMEISPTGTIRFLDRGMVASQSKDEFEQWLQAGRLA